MNALLTLADRAEAGSGPDWDLDVDVDIAAYRYGHIVNTLTSSWGRTRSGEYSFTPDKTMLQAYGEYPDQKPMIGVHFHTPAFTSEMDACEKFRAEKLPGSLLVIDQYADDRWHVGIKPKDGAHWQHGHAPDGRRAYLAAMLRAIAGGVER